MNRRGTRRFRVGEQLEQRCCLSAVVFITHTSEVSRFTTSVHAADLDSDGDMDVLSVHLGGIAWYENTDGQGMLRPRGWIDGKLPFVEKVEAADLDGDSDLDVIATAPFLGVLVWYENTDGEGIFGPQQGIPGDSGSHTGLSLHTVDVDGDGDLDVLSPASYHSHEVVWYENEDGRGHFLENEVVESASTLFVFPSDVDGDGDVDLLSTSRHGPHSYDDYTIEWYENTNGSGEFELRQQIVLDDFVTVRSMFAADLDSDGDIDVVTAYRSDDKIAWYENTDGNGSFGPEQVITTEANRTESVYAADVDGDGDVDLLTTSRRDDKIAWYENTDGNGSFGEQMMLITEVENPWSVFAADLDGDGDVDVLAGSGDWSDNEVPFGTIFWLENRILADSNDDGTFDSSDLVAVFQAGKYEDGIDDNATFDEGDWNQDGDFDSADLVFAFQAGHYVAAAQPLEAEIAAAVEAVFADDDDAKKARAFVA